MCNIARFVISVRNTLLPIQTLPADTWAPVPNVVTSLQRHLTSLKSPALRGLISSIARFAVFPADPSPIRLDQAIRTRLHSILEPVANAGILFRRLTRLPILRTAVLFTRKLAPCVDILPRRCTTSYTTTTKTVTGGNARTAGTRRRCRRILTPTAGVPSAICSS